MDAEMKWMTRLPDIMFPANAQMFIFHVRSSYIAFCTPAEKSDEFILTDRVYSLLEGPTHSTFYFETGDYIGNTYLCFYEFEPISPRIMIILRSNILPEAMGDMYSKMNKTRQRMLYAASAQFPDLENVRSILGDLPAAKAMNPYSRVVNGRLELAPGEFGTPRSKDRFAFQVWPISTDHTNVINSMFLDNLLHCNSIVFGSRVPFQQTLVAYMTTQANGFKKIGMGEYGAGTARLACLKKFEIVLEKLGIESLPIFWDESGKANKPFIRCFDDSSLFFRYSTCL